MVDLEDSYVGTTYSTSRGGVLTVIRSNGLKGQDKRYIVSCSICSKENPNLVFDSKKSNLVQGSVPCSCNKFVDRFDHSKQLFTKKGSKVDIIKIHENRDRGNRKLYECVCRDCYNKDPELFKHPMLLTADKIRDRHFHCSCSSHVQWTKYQYAILCKRKAVLLGYRFIYFYGDYKHNSTKLILRCREHGEWVSCTISKLLGANQGCPGCKKAATSRRVLKSDEEMITSFFATGKFKKGTKFWRSDRVDAVGHKPYWKYTCPICSDDEYVQNGLCSGIFEATSSSIQKGQIGCRCRKSGRKFTEEEVVFRINKTLTSENGKFIGWKGNVYKNCYSKFNWTCSEGHLCETAVTSFTNSGIRCPSCSRHGFNKQREAYLYIVEWCKSVDTKFIKFGITNNVESRVKSQAAASKMYSYSVVKVYEFDKGVDANWLEKEIKNNFDCGVMSKTDFKDGFTETIEFCSKNRLICFVDSLYQQHLEDKARQEAELMDDVVADWEIAKDKLV